MAKYQFSLVACARWEETQIQEWVEYHKSIGFQHIYLYSNDDDPQALFSAVAPWVYGPDPFITFRHWPHVGQQTPIYLHFLDTFKQETAWFAFLDIDEFFVLKRLDNIALFMHDYEDSVDCLSFNWLVYGNSGKLQRDSNPTLMSYLRRARAPDVRTKMICRSAALDADAIRQGVQNGRGAFWHFLDNYHLPALRCGDVLHESTQGYSADFPASARPFLQREGYAEAVIDRAYIAHFQFKSEADFLRRWRRGGFPNGEQWRTAFETGAHRSILEASNVVYDSYLAEYWHRYTAPALCFSTQPAYGSPAYRNVGLNKPSFQSSVFEPQTEEPAGSRVSGAGNNGVRTGSYGFHTRFQAQPWWIVDLLAPHLVGEIHLYNRLGDPAVTARANELDVSVSADGANWTTLLSRSESEPFGRDGVPLVVRGSPTLPCRFVLVRLRGTNFLHLDEVEVYGQPA